MRINKYKFLLLLMLFICGCNKTANEYYEEGVKYYKNEDDAEAIKNFSKAIELDSTFFEAYLYLGKSYYFNYDLELSIKSLLKAKSLKTNVEVFRRLGVAYKDIDSLDDAIRIYEEGMNKFSDDETLIYYLASCYNQKGYYNKSLELLENLVKLNPDSFDVYHLIGQNLYSLNEYHVAIEYYKFAISKSPNKDFLYYDLSRAYLKINQIDSALISASKTVALNNLDEKNLFLLSSVFLFNGNIDSSDYYFEQLKDVLISDYRLINEESDFEADY